MCSFALRNPADGYLAGQENGGCDAGLRILITSELQHFDHEVEMKDFCFDLVSTATSSDTSSCMS